MTTQQLDLIGTHEITARHGLTRMQVFHLIRAGDFPKPVAEIGIGRVWDGSEVKERIRELKRSGRITPDAKLVPWRYTKNGRA